jgi:hypothetical protein
LHRLSPPTVTQVIVDPVIASLRPSDVFQFNAYVRQTDTVAKTVVWTVVGATGTALQAGTTIDATGKLTVASTQTGELIVQATVAGTGIDIDGAGPDTTDVYGQSIVTIVS